MHNLQLQKMMLGRLPFAANGKPAKIRKADFFGQEPERDFWRSLV
jgi:hypothetical protein